MIKAGIIGSTGYAGQQLVWLLHSHKNVKIVFVSSHNHADVSFSDVYPHYAGLFHQKCVDIPAAEEQFSSIDVLFIALPHGKSSVLAEKAIQSGVKVIDLGADFRLKDSETYQQWYQVNHPCPYLLEKAVYGLPELHQSKIQKASLVANPGCYPTASILALAPLLKAKAIDPSSIIIDAKSGASGAGRSLSPDLHFCEAHENIKAYKVATHRHTSEIEQELGVLAGKELTISFTPHLLPIKRGILSTMYATLTGEYSFEDVYSLYSDFYKGEPFIVLHQEDSLPQVKYVNGSNMCHIGFVIDKRVRRIIVVSALDNLIKGAGGQAVQNMNILFGLEETTGLLNPGWYL